MTISRPYVVVAVLAGASAVAACGSSGATGPSGASLARIFDSAYVADSTAGHGGEPRALLENYLALFADEGLTPVSVVVKVDGGTLPMLMMAAISYDTTASGAPADSLALVAGWTPDYSKYVLLITEAFTQNGPRVSRVRVTSARLEALASMVGARGRRVHRPPTSPTRPPATSRGRALAGAIGNMFPCRASMRTLRWPVRAWPYRSISRCTFPRRMGSIRHSPT
jgi:hypothetical protein